MNRRAALCSLRQMRGAGPVRAKAEAVSRSFSSAARVQRQHLYWAGNVLDRVSPYLQRVPRDWLASVGMERDVDEGLSFTHAAGSVSHSLLAYKTVPRPKGKGKDREIESDVVLTTGEVAPAEADEGLHKILAVGRNTHGQLGLGFTSQESSWGMVTGHFDGTSIERLACGNCTSFVVVKQQDGSSALYAMGNHTQGQLGLGAERSATTESGDAQLILYSSPTRVDLSATGSSPPEIMALATGLDHLLVLCRSPERGTTTLLSCGINTDGQLGLGEGSSCSSSTTTTTSTLQPVQFDLEEGDEIIDIAAGGDTSFAWSRAGRLWAWGNAEYAQSMHGCAIDQIRTPLEATDSLRAAGIGRIRCLAAGGSFAALLDDDGRLFTVGYGAIGHGAEELQTDRLRRLESLPLVQRITADLEYSGAVDQHGVLHTWGLDTMAGRLGLDPPSRKPWPSFMIASRCTPDASRVLSSFPGGGGDEQQQQDSSKAQRSMLCHRTPAVVQSAHSLEGQRITHAACSGDAMWVLTEDGESPVGVWDAP